MAKGLVACRPRNRPVGFPQCRRRTDYPGQAGGMAPKRHSRLLAWKAFSSIRGRTVTGNPRTAQVLPGDLLGGCCVRSHAPSHRDPKNGAFRTLLRRDAAGRTGTTLHVAARIKAAADSPRLRVRRIAVSHGMGGRPNINSGSGGCARGHAHTRLFFGVGQLNVPLEDHPKADQRDHGSWCVIVRHSATTSGARPPVAITALTAPISSVIRSTMRST